VNALDSGECGLVRLEARFEGKLLVEVVMARVLSLGESEAQGKIPCCL